MPQAEFFSRLGLFTRRNFFSAELCQQLRDNVSAMPGTHAKVLADGQEVLDQRLRDVTCVDEDLAVETNRMLKTRMRELHRELENHFSVKLTGFENPQCLMYRAGNFYKPHTDSNTGANVPEIYQARQVSVVLFLNQEANSPDTTGYQGGHLTFYGLLDGPQWQHCPLPLISDTGLLVAFRSNVLHEVQPVLSGVRYTIVTWFY